MSFLQRTGEWKFAAALGAALAISACAKTPADNASLAGLNGGAPAAPGSPQDFAVNVGDRIFFDSDSSDLNQTAQATLAKQASWLQQYARYNVTVEGHADERGTREYNFALGARRAETTKDYLVARGIPASKIHTISYGKERPVTSCNDNSCWSQNRRAVTVLTGGQS
ncbi:MAG: peptidoglycan-associated lipoprotein Pal [Methylocella sp.]